MSPSLSLLSSLSLTSFTLYLSLIKIFSISFGKNFLIHHMFPFWSHPWFAIRESSKLLSKHLLQIPAKIFAYFYVLPMSKPKELKYQQLCFHSNIGFDILQTKLHSQFFFPYRRYDIQIHRVLLKGHQIYPSHLQVLQRCFGIWNCPGVF